MKQTWKKFAFLFHILLVFCLLFSGCGKTDAPIQEIPLAEEASQENSSETIPSEEKGTRDNTSVVRTPVSSGTTVFSCDTAIIDASNTQDGYFMADYTGTTEKVKLQLTGPDNITYTYNLHGAGYEVFPFTAGDGNYTVGIYENISETKYSLALSADISVTLENPFGPYLYPNQYVNFNASSLPVLKAASLAYTADTDLEVLEQIYNYIIENFTYDYDKAATVTSGYLPVIDEVFESGTGICFDYTAVMAAMLRSQNIPTRLEVGYMGEEYHAWISIYIEEIGWINGIIEFDGSTWKLLDPTFASTSKSPKNFLTETDKYVTKYIY